MCCLKQLAISNHVSMPRKEIKRKKKVNQELSCKVPKMKNEGPCPRGSSLPQK